MYDFKEMLNQDVQNQDSITMIGDDFIILDNPILYDSGRFPYRNEWLIATLCEAGSAEGSINLRDYQVRSGGFIIILPGQVITRSEMSAGFKGKVLLMSRNFSESLDIQKTLAITARIETRPYYQFGKDSLEIVHSYISSCKTMIRHKGNDDTIREVLRLLTKAFFIGAGSLLSECENFALVGPYGRVTEAYLSLVEEKYRHERQLSWYASRLGRSPKYLSNLIKEETGRNATDWIELCVVMDAKARLLSKREKIQDISDSLGFPSQSFFGKYFKRVTGLSPKAFRNNELER